MHPLLLMCQRRKRIKDYKPISLVGSIFKILFKVRSNKFKRFRSTLKFTALFLGGLGLGDRGEMG